MFLHNFEYKKQHKHASAMQFEQCKLHTVLSDLGHYLYMPPKKGASLQSGFHINDHHHQDDFKLSAVSDKELIDDSFSEFCNFKFSTVCRRSSSSNCDFCIWKYRCSLMSRVMRKPAFCICENKDADELRGNRTADQRLCFPYIDSTIPLLPNSEFSSLIPSSMVVQPDFCRTWSETPKTGFLAMRL